MAIYFGEFVFLNVPCKKVDLDLIRLFIEDNNTKRINFASTHSNALKRVDGRGCVAWLNLPFNETIETIACKELSLDILVFPYSTDTGVRRYRRHIDTEDEYVAMEGFINKYKDLVFLRDTLDLSIALSMREVDESGRTELGQHEYRVKYRSGFCDTSADMKALILEMQHRLDELPFFKFADYICAVPSSKPFMKDIIGGLNGFAFEDISDHVNWNNKTGSLKDVESAAEKLDMIQSWELHFDENLDLNDKTVLLVDDMYQSGVTMQYIAMKMKEAGARRVFGIALVKALGNE